MLVSLLGGPVVTGLINAYKAKLDAANTQDRIAADLAAKEIEAETEARKQSCVASLVCQAIRTS